MEYQSLILYLKKSVNTGLLKSVFPILSFFVFMPLIINNIGMSNFGYVMMSLLFVGASSLDLGLSRATTLLIGKSSSKAEANQVFTASFIMIFLISILIICIMYFLLYYEISFLGSSLDIKNQNTIYIYIVFTIFINLLLVINNNLLSAVLESYYLMHYVNIGYALYSFFSYFLLYIFSLITKDLEILIFSFTIAYLILYIYYFMLVLYLTEIRITKITWNNLLSNLHISLKFFKISIINSLVLPINKYLLITYIGNPAFYAMFDIALRISMLFNNILNTISIPLFGVFSNFKENQLKEIYFIISKVTKIVLFFYIIGIIVYYFLGSQILLILNKENYLLLHSITSPLIIALGMASLSEPTYRALLATNNLNAAFYLKLLIPILNIFLFFILINTLEIKYVFIYSYSGAVVISSCCILMYGLKKINK